MTMISAWLRAEEPDHSEPPEACSAERTRRIGRGAQLKRAGTAPADPTEGYEAASFFDLAEELNPHFPVGALEEQEAGSLLPID